MLDLPAATGRDTGKSPVRDDCLSRARALSSPLSMPKTRLAGLAEDAPGGSTRRSRADRPAASVAAVRALRATSPARVTHQPKER